MNLPKFKAKRADNGKWIEGDLIHNYWMGDGNFIPFAIRFTINGVYSFPTEIIPETLCQFTGIVDKDGVEIYSDDIRSNSVQKFRIYAVPGGFAVKADYWSTDLSDLVMTDELIVEPIANPQLAGWLKESTKSAGNYHDLKE